MASDLTERRAALRALLVERADASAPRRGARPRDAEPGRLRMTLVTGAVAVAVVAATVVALRLPGTGEFLGGPASTATPVPAATSDAPTPTPTAPATRPPVADPTPTNAPTAEAPVPTRTPVSPPTATSTPPASGLITPTGFQRITRAQLHDFVVSTGSSENDGVWEEQQWIIIGCMAEHGFVYDPITEYHAPLAWKDGLTAAQQQAYDEAMYGPPRSGAYDWRTAGCDGLAVHETGMDGAN